MKEEKKDKLITFLAGPETRYQLEAIRKYRNQTKGAVLRHLIFLGFLALPTVSVSDAVEPEDEELLTRLRQEHERRASVRQPI